MKQPLEYLTIHTLLDQVKYDSDIECFSMNYIKFSRESGILDSKAVSHLGLSDDEENLAPFHWIYSIDWRYFLFQRTCAIFLFQ